MKVFISHQSAQSIVAGQIALRLQRVHGIDCYLDVIDPYLRGRCEDLAAHIRMEKRRCTQLLAVISYNSTD